jgi:hypothetical protein
MGKKIRPLGAAVIVRLADIYPREDYHQRINYIKHLPKDYILQILAFINILLDRMPASRGIYKMQLTVLQSLIGKDHLAFNKFKKFAYDFYKEQSLKAPVPSGTPYIFSRTTIVCAIEEILSSNLQESQKGVQDVDPECILKYILAINSYLSKSQHLTNSTNVTFYENMVAAVSPINEYELPINPVVQFLRGIHLFKFLKGKKDVTHHINDWFNQIGIQPEKYVLSILQIAFLIIENRKPHLPLIAPSNQLEKIIMERFSKHESIKSKSPLEVLKLKKYPLFKLEEEKYLVLDVHFFIDKTYYSLVNDFFFDYLQSKNIRRDYYMSMIGSFYENYICSLIRKSFAHQKHSPPQALSDLKRKTAKGKVELADFYVRKNKKVILGQVKASLMNRKQKFGEIIDFYRTDKKRFYKAFGVEQIVRKSIKYLLHSPDMYESEIESYQGFHIQPIIVLNERILYTPLIGIQFQEYFMKLLKEEMPEVEIPGKHYHCIRYKKKSIIRPLILLGAYDLEMLERLLRNKKVDIWKLFKDYVDQTQLQLPFRSTTDKYFDKKNLTHQFEEILPYLRSLQSEAE